MRIFNRIKTTLVAAGIACSAVVSPVLISPSFADEAPQDLIEESSKSLYISIGAGISQLKEGKARKKYIELK